MSDARWERAQKAERRHASHENTEWGFDQCATFFAEQFDTNINSFENKTVVAVGSGTGGVHGLFNDCRAIALDPMNSDIGTSLDNSPANLLTGMGERIPLAEDTADVIVSHNVLDHVETPLDTLSDMRRVLKPDGRVLLTVNVFKLPPLVRRMFDPIDRPHPHHFSPSEVESLAKEAGYTIDDSQVREVVTTEPNMKMRIALAFTRIKRIHLWLSDSR